MERCSVRPRGATEGTREYTGDLSVVGDQRMQTMPTIHARHPVVALGALGLTLALGFSACNKVPYTGRSQVVALSLDAEAQLGADAFTEILAAESVIPSGDLRNQVATVAGGVAETAPAPFSSLDWDFKLINSESVNAFALPGGKVGVYTGILPVLSNEAGLASVLGHEVGHVVARHSAERITGMLALQSALTAADIGLSNTELHDELMALLGLGATVGVVLPFSRANELESDYLGGIFMAKAGFEPNESWAVWERMSALGGGGSIAIFSTHPSNSKRIERLKEEQPTFQKYYKSAKTKNGRGDDLRIDLVPAAPQGQGATKGEDTGSTDSGSTGGKGEGSGADSGDAGSTGGKGESKGESKGDAASSATDSGSTSKPSTKEDTDEGSSGSGSTKGRGRR